MKKQKKQLLLLTGILIVAVALWFVVDYIPQQTQEEEESYQVTNFDNDEIIRLTYTNESGTYSFTRKEEEWQYEEDKSVDIEESVITNMIGKLSSYDSENRITGVEDLSVYGLDEPVKTILLASDTASCTFIIGDYNQTTYTYYMCLEEDTSTVYTVTSTDISVFDNTLEEVTAAPTQEETMEDGETLEDTSVEDISE